MESLKELYKIGSGPSSSHTIAPQRAVKLFLDKYKDTVSLRVVLYGSLSLTGKGHFTDQAVIMAAKDIPCTVEFSSADWEHDFPNGLTIEGFDCEQNPTGNWTVFSLGGGSIKVLNENFDFQKNVYPHDSIEKIKKVCKRKKYGFEEYVFEIEPELRPYLKNILNAMIDAVERGMRAEGYLLGHLRIKRSAKDMFRSLSNLGDVFSESVLKNRKLCTYAYANMEENACLGAVVTAPTCGSSGVLAACMYYYFHDKRYDLDRLVNALAVAGIFGNVVKTNATISGAEGGCQAEVGVACAMSAAAISYLEGASIEVIEYAAEIAMEHHLGLTCDPLSGYVIIPCIERNAVATNRAFEAAHTASFLAAHKKILITFDMVVETMKYTGSKIALELRETSLGGLATAFSLKRETLYYNDGSVRATGMVDSSGLKQNQWVHYRKTGHLWHIGYYHDDIKNGPYVKMKIGGDIESIEFYKAGKLLKMPLLRHAVMHAFKRHEGHTRKGGNKPYILHPLEALGIAFKIAPNEEKLLAAVILHDTIEDTEETYENLKNLFGDVADIVREVSEDKSKTWQERKQATIDYLKKDKCSYEAKICTLSDKLSNARAMSEDLKEFGSIVWDKFNEKNPKKQKWYYREVCDALIDFADTSAWKELNSLVDLM